jgi:hypothetical protein
MVGIAPQIEIFSSWISWSTSSASKRPRLKTSFAPIVICVHTIECSPPTWNSGDVNSDAG